MDQKLVYEQESYAIRGAVFEVYREMGCGFVEPVYQECFEKELELNGIPFEAQGDLRLAYKGGPLKQRYQTDLVCYGKIIVELKAVQALLDKHRAQLLNYLKASKMRFGFLVNFGAHPKAEIERIVL